MKTPKKNILLKIWILTFLSLMLSVMNGSTQPLGELSTTSKKATKNFNKAINIYESNAKLAIAFLEKAIKADKNFIEAYMLMGDIASLSNNDSLALASYEKAVEINPDFFPPNLYNVGKLYLEKGNYLVAKKRFTQFMTYTFTSDNLKELARQGIKNCDFAIEAMLNPVDFRPSNIGEGVNSDLDEYFPSLTVDEKKILFTRRLLSNASVDGFNEDLYISEIENYRFGPAKNIGRPINTMYNEGASSISPDGQIIVFTICDMFSTGNYGEGRKGYGRCDIFYSFRNGNSWTEPENIGKPINSANWESQPVFGVDGKTLYFVRRTVNEDGISNADIYCSILNSKGVWGKPVKLNANINTPKTEMAVFVHPDDQTLYFSSDGHTGMGGLDIFMSKRELDGSWGPAVNLGYPINTHADENSFIVNGSGTHAYFTSDREGGYGGLDIYSFEIPQHLRPEPVTYLKGIVFDTETLHPLAARFQLIDLSSADTIVESFSDPATGDFLVPLPSDKEFMLNVYRDGYLFFSENIEIAGSYSLLKPYEKDIPLQPVKTGERIVLKNVFFDHDQFTLKEESALELQRIVELLQKNQTIHIEIGGHTDNSGSTAYNQTLSENRAKAVYQYLIDHGISKKRLSYKGYGEHQPIDTNESAEGRSNNRRTEMKITGRN